MPETLSKWIYFQRSIISFPIQYSNLSQATQRREQLIGNFQAFFCLAHLLCFFFFHFHLANTPPHFLSAYINLCEPCVVAATPFDNAHRQKCGLAVIWNGSISITSPILIHNNKFNFLIKKNERNTTWHHAMHESSKRTTEHTKRNHENWTIRKDV